ncbi:MAG: pyridoxamine 5'-phosphate oxidase [Roseiarcus sp.]
MNALNSSDFTQARDPFALFRQWMAEAAKSEVNDPEAMTLASVDESGLPDARIMLCKGADERGFVFYTNAESAKGRELAATPKAAVLFHWKSLRRPVRARGAGARVPDNESDAFFASRPRASRIGAWASQQSRPLESRAKLLQAVAVLAAKFGIGDIPRPPYWGGYRLTPTEIEFWQDVQFRLHDRVLFKRAREGEPWSRERLFP